MPSLARNNGSILPVDEELICYAHFVEGHSMLWPVCCQYIANLWSVCCQAIANLSHLRLQFVAVRFARWTDLDLSDFRRCPLTMLVATFRLSALRARCPAAQVPVLRRTRTSSACRRTMPRWVCLALGPGAPCVEIVLRRGRTTAADAVCPQPQV